MDTILSPCPITSQRCEAPGLCVLCFLEEPVPLVDATKLLVSLFDLAAASFVFTHPAKTLNRAAQRCDSGKPICGTCLVHERDCVYEPRKSKLRKLEERLKTLEQAFTIVEGVQSCSGPFSNYSKGSTRLDIPELVLSPNTPFPVSDERIPDLEVWNTSEELPVSLRVQL